MKVESFTYRDHHMDFYRLGTGWVAMIYAPGQDDPLPQMPMARSEDGLDTIVAIAQLAIDLRHSRLPGRPRLRGLRAVLATIGRRTWPAVFATLAPRR
jgi:hypothetical protein